MTFFFLEYVSLIYIFYVLITKYIWVNKYIYKNILNNFMSKTNQVFFFIIFCAVFQFILLKWLQASLLRAL